MTRDKDKELQGLQAAIDRQLKQAQMPLWRILVPAMVSGAFVVVLGVLLGKLLFPQ